MPMYNPWEEAQRKGIEVVEADLKNACGYFNRKERLIIISKNLSSSQKREILAHVLCHEELSYRAGVPCESYLSQVYQSEHEVRIDRETTKKLVPKSELRKYLKLYPESTIAELAGFFDVTERIINIALRSFEQSDPKSEGCTQKRHSPDSNFQP